VAKFPCCVGPFIPSSRLCSTKTCSHSSTHARGHVCHVAALSWCHVPTLPRSLRPIFHFAKITHKCLGADLIAAGSVVRFKSACCTHIPIYSHIHAHNHSHEPTTARPQPHPRSQPHAHKQQLHAQPHSHSRSHPLVLSSLPTTTALIQLSLDALRSGARSSSSSPKTASSAGAAAAAAAASTPVKTVAAPAASASGGLKASARMFQANHHPAALDATPKRFKPKPLSAEDIEAFNMGGFA
jgi:hypothetical protein